VQDLVLEMDVDRPDATYNLAQDILQGAQAIADFGGWTRRQVYHFVGHGLPVFRIGSNLCARKSSILAWIELQERSGNSTKGKL
jgi:hypothetical protein